MITLAVSAPSRVVSTLPLRWLACLLAASACVDPPHGAREREAPAATTAGPRRTATAPANGFGDGIAWQPLEAGLAAAKDSGDPMLLVVHASWCPKCKDLKAAFTDEELVALSDRFVMVNVDQDAVPRAAEFGPDGNYVPRVIVVDPASGRPDTSLVNERRNRTIYYYSPADDLVGTMKKALTRYGKT